MPDRQIFLELPQSMPPQFVTPELVGLLREVKIEIANHLELDYLNSSSIVHHGVHYDNKCIESIIVTAGATAFSAIEQATMTDYAFTNAQH